MNFTADTPVWLYSDFMPLNSSGGICSENKSSSSPLSLPEATDQDVVMSDPSEANYILKHGAIWGGVLFWVGVTVI